ncbi:MAG: hypothetical protein J6U88_05415 [Bacteroidales bacterium]|nr:hypothetical protein [Bacteroidales bacterium]
MNILHTAERKVREAGLAEGLAENKLQVAKNLLKKRMSLSDITDVTVLSKEEIEKL